VSRSLAGEAGQEQERSALKGGLLSLLAHCAANGAAGKKVVKEMPFPDQSQPVLLVSTVFFDSLATQRRSGA
jgi:hypothetical protein